MNIFLFGNEQATEGHNLWLQGTVVGIFHHFIDQMYNQLIECIMNIGNNP